MRKIKTGKPLSERESESLTTYLDEIGRAKLLSEEEERELSEKIKNGDARALANSNQSCGFLRCFYK